MFASVGSQPLADIRWTPHRPLTTTMHPPSRLIVPALFAFNQTVIDAHASLGSLAETLARRDDTHRIIKRQIRNATNAPPTPTTNNTTTSADTIKVQKRLVPLDDSSANLFDSSELPRRLVLPSETAFRKPTVDWRTQLLEDRAASMSAVRQGSRSVRLNPDSNLFGRDARDLSKKNQQDFILDWDINEEIRAAWMKQRAAHYHDLHHILRHIVKHEYHTPVSVVKHAIPARMNTAGTSPESMQDVPDTKRNAIHSGSYE